MSDVDEGYAELFLHILQLVLHILPQLEVERRERLVEEKHLRLIYERSGDRHTLLLTAGQARHAAVFESRQIHEAEHLRNALLYLILRYLLKLQSERNVFVYVVVRKKRVPLEDRVDGTLVRGETRDAFSVKKNFA